MADPEEGRRQEAHILYSEKHQAALYRQFRVGASIHTVDDL